MAFEIKIVKNTSDFEKLSSDWDKLLIKSRNDNPFLIFEWVFTWWEHFGKNYKLHLILAYDNNELVGAAPLVIARRYLFRELRFLGYPFADYQDIIITGDLDKRQGILNAILSFVNKSGGWDILRITNIRVTSFNFKVFNIIKDNGGKLSIRLEMHGEGAPYLRISEDWDSYYSKLKKGFIADTKRQLSRLSDKQLSFSSVINSDKNDFSSLLNKLIEFHRIRRKEKGTKSILDSQENSSFIKEVSLRLSQRGFLDLSCLKVDGKIAAIALSLVYNNRFFYYIPSYNAEFSKLSISRLLIFDLVRKCFDNRFDEFDFMLGEESYKYDWAPVVEPLYYLTIYPKSFFGFIAYQVFNRLNYKIRKKTNKK